MAKEPVVAIVDDDESVREALKGLMKSLGFAAPAFPCAEDFLESSWRHETSCVIADVQMSGMSGVELRETLVASGHPIPTILISAYPDDRARARALQAGVVGYFAKPFNDDDLLAGIRIALASDAGTSSRCE